MIHINSFFNYKTCFMVVFKLTPSVPVWTCPLKLRVRKGEWVERRLSHSLGRGAGTDSMKLFFSSRILAWCLMISS